MLHNIFLHGILGRTLFIDFFSFARLKFGVSKDTNCILKEKMNTLMNLQQHVDMEVLIRKNITFQFVVKVSKNLLATVKCIRNK
jgi:hypothetical protein